jgi:hypothetical protein
MPKPNPEDLVIIRTLSGKARVDATMKLLLLLRRNIRDVRQRGPCCHGTPDPRAWHQAEEIARQQDQREQHGTLETRSVHG